MTQRKMIRNHTHLASITCLGFNKLSAIHLTWLYIRWSLNTINDGRASAKYLSCLYGSHRVDPKPHAELPANHFISLILLESAGVSLISFQSERIDQWNPEMHHHHPSMGRRLLLFAWASSAIVWPLANKGEITKRTILHCVCTHQRVHIIGWVEGGCSLLLDVEHLEERKMFIAFIYIGWRKIMGSISEH